jgi:uncharacterized membrane protein
MFLHPVVAVFMLFWFGGVGAAVAAVASSRSSNTFSVLVPTFMLLFGVALTLGGFYPEARWARRLLEDHLSGSSGLTETVQPTCSPRG